MLEMRGTKHSGGRRKSCDMCEAETEPCEGWCYSAKGNHIERPLNLVCPLEIRSSVGVDEDPQAVEVEDVPRRALSERRAAKEAQRNIRSQLSELEEL